MSRCHPEGCGWRPTCVAWLPALAGRLWLSRIDGSPAAAFHLKAEDTLRVRGLRLQPGRPRQASCSCCCMVHPYPPHCDDLPYVGKHHYFLTFCTERLARFFVEPPKVELVLSQFLRAGSEGRFALTAYCFMPDHVHLIASGLAQDADVKRFIARAKQYSGFHFKREFGIALWQRYASTASFATTWNWRALLATLSPTPSGQGW